MKKFLLSALAIASVGTGCAVLAQTVEDLQKAGRKDDAQKICDDLAALGGGAERYRPRL